MLSRVLLDSEDWLVSVGLLGVGAVRATNRAGTTVKATIAEKLYLMRVLETFQKLGLAISPSSPLVAAVLSDFATAIHHRPKPGLFGGGAVYRVFFSAFEPAGTAQRFIEKLHQRLARHAS